MKYVDGQTFYVRELLFPIIGETKSKTYFSYYGIFKDKMMFALYKNGKFYLRASYEYIEEIHHTEGTELLCERSLGIQSNHFYLLPEYIMNRLPKYSHWIHSILKEMKEEKDKKDLIKKQAIRFMPNMTLGLERTLKKIGVCTRSDFIQKGAIYVFVELMKIGIDASDILLYKLYGAVSNKYIEVLTETEKENILKAANHALHKEGLRRRFNV